MSRREADLIARIRAANTLGCRLVIHSDQECQGLRDVARRHGLVMPPVTLRPLKQKNATA